MSNMPKCEANKAFNAPACDENAYANITIRGDKGSVDINICKGHLEEVTRELPTKESEHAKRQRQ